MDLSNIDIIAKLKAKMAYHNERQALLAQNIANANTPGYIAKDIPKASFKNALNNINGSGAGSLTRTNPAHISASGGFGSGSSFNQSMDFEVSPTGNSVNLEEQMLKMNENALDYRTTTSLYKKVTNLMKIAVEGNK